MLSPYYEELKKMNRELEKQDVSAVASNDEVIKPFHYGTMSWDRQLTEKEMKALYDAGDGISQDELYKLVEEARDKK
jgi:hypothetical protein